VIIVNDFRLQAAVHC